MESCLEQDIIKPRKEPYTLADMACLCGIKKSLSAEDNVNIVLDLMAGNIRARYPEFNDLDTKHFSLELKELSYEIAVKNHRINKNHVRRSIDNNLKHIIIGGEEMQVFGRPIDCAYSADDILQLGYLPHGSMSYAILAHELLLRAGVKNYVWYLFNEHDKDGHAVIEYNTSKKTRFCDPKYHRRTEFLIADTEQIEDFESGNTMMNVSRNKVYKHRKKIRPKE